MRDIVATIQPEQDEIVRAGADQTICVQGAPGTGKTAVGLHRAAWLLYAFRDRLARSGVLVIGPNRAFLEHIGAVLPALGEVAVGHTTIEELVASVPVRGTDSTATAVLKGDARLAEVLRYAVWSAVQHATEPLVVPRGVRKWRVPAYEVERHPRRAASRGGCATTRPGRCCRSGWPTRSCCRWRGPATPPTTGCRTRWPAAPS